MLLFLLRICTNVIKTNGRRRRRRRTRIYLIRIDIPVAWYNDAHT